MIGLQCQYDILLGDWKSRGFTIREQEDTVDENDKLLVVYFQGKRVATYYRSKIMGNIGSYAVIQTHCENYWNNTLKQFTGE